MCAVNIARLILALGLLAGLAPRSASADVLSYTFEGDWDTWAIEGIPRPPRPVFTGTLRFDLDAAVLYDSGSVVRYLDPEATLEVASEGLVFRGVGGLEIHVTRAAIPGILDLYNLRFLASVVEAEGTGEPIDSMSLTFFGSVDDFPDTDIPELLDPALLNGQLFIASPDLPPPSGFEPPRTGFIGGALSDFALLPLERDDVVIDVLPRRRHNRVTPGRPHLPVAVLGSETVSVLDLFGSSLHFGPAGAQPLPLWTHPLFFLRSLRDVNRDGFLDVIALFATAETGLLPGISEACLEGELGGVAFRACDDVRVWWPAWHDPANE